jgi:predicted transglutaminase-like cysteine proteinase
MTKTTKTLGILVAALTTLGSQTAIASPSNMLTDGTTNPPIGHYEFCQSNPAECGDDGGDSGPAPLTKAGWKTILNVNYTVNSSIQPATDMQIYGVEERWAYPKTIGDCEDYALLKRKMLIRSGFSPSDLLMTVVLQPNGEGHAVLTVRTDRGDFILDNMRNKVLLWSDTEYTFLKRQSSDNAARWVKLEDGHSSNVGSIK